MFASPLWDKYSRMEHVKFVEDILEYFVPYEAI